MENKFDPPPAFPCNLNGFSGLSKREYAAIHLRVPNSGDTEIDNMIRAARRFETAQMIWADGQTLHADNAFNLADELIAKGEGK